MAYRHVLPFSSTAGMVLYLAAMSFDLGGRSIAFIDGPLAKRVFGHDREEETILKFLARWNSKSGNQEAEDTFYAFVRQEGI